MSLVFGEIKKNLLIYLTHLSVYEYIAYGWVILLFIFLLIFSIVISSKKPILSVFLIFFNFVFLVFSPLFVSVLMDKSVRKTKIFIEKRERLHYGNSLIVEGKVINIGKIDFDMCKVNMKVYKVSKSFLKNYLYLLKPLGKKTIWIRKPLKRKNQESFKIVLDPFYYKGDFNISVKAECY